MGHTMAMLPVSCQALTVRHACGIEREIYILDGKKIYLRKYLSDGMSPIIHSMQFMEGMELVRYGHASDGKAE